MLECLSATMADSKPSIGNFANWVFSVPILILLSDILMTTFLV